VYFRTGSSLRAANARESRYREIGIFLDEKIVIQRQPAPAGKVGGRGKGLGPFVGGRKSCGGGIKKASKHSENDWGYGKVEMNLRKKREGHLGLRS